MKFSTVLCVVLRVNTSVTIIIIIIICSVFLHYIAFNFLNTYMLSVNIFPLLGIGFMEIPGMVHRPINTRTTLSQFLTCHYVNCRARLKQQTYVLHACNAASSVDLYLYISCSQLPQKCRLWEKNGQTIGRHYPDLSLAK